MASDLCDPAHDGPATRAASPTRRSAARFPDVQRDVQRDVRCAVRRAVHGSGRRSRSVAVLAAIATFGVGCAGPVDGNAGDSDRPDLDPGDTGTVVVSAAASLRDPIAAIAEQFEAKHPGARVRLNLASSSRLAQQLLDGAPADVAAFADTAPMDRLATDGRLASEPQVFATNGMVIVTRPGNPDPVDSLSDLDDLRTVSLCVQSAPCGAFADQLLDDAGVTLDEGSVTRGQDATATLGAVSRGDADAGVVYRTDARGAGDRVDIVGIDGADRSIAQYPIAEVAGSASPGLARSFVEHVLGDDGRRVLRAAGFGPPPPPAS